LAAVWKLLMAGGVSRWAAFPKAGGAVVKGRGTLFGLDFFGVFLIFLASSSEQKLLLAAAALAIQGLWLLLGREGVPGRIDQRLH